MDKTMVIFEYLKSSFLTEEPTLALPQISWEKLKLHLTIVVHGKAPTLLALYIK